MIRSRRSLQQPAPERINDVEELNDKTSKLETKQKRTFAELIRHYAAKGFKWLAIGFLIGLAIFAILYMVLFGVIEGFAKSQLAGLHWLAEWSGPISFLIAILATGPLLKSLGNALIGRKKHETYSVIGLAVVIICVTAYFGQYQIMAIGKVARYICPPSFVDGDPDISIYEKNQDTGHSCVLVGPKTAVMAQGIMRGKKRPSKIELKEVGDTKNFNLRNAGLPVVYKSSVLDDNGQPILFNGPWFDDLADTESSLLIEATRDDVKKIKAFLAAQTAKETNDANKKAGDAAKAKADAEKALTDKANEKEKLYWKKRYTDTVTSMNVEARKVATGGLSDKEIEEAKLMYLNLSGTLDETKLMLPENERPKIRLEPLPGPRSNEGRTTTNSTPTPTSTAGDEVIIIVRLINRDPPKPFFEYGTGLKGNRVSVESAGIYISSVGKECERVSISIDNAEATSICKHHKNPLKVNAGSVYKIDNRTGKTILGKVMRSEIM
jgi:hypothetical protein